jgi:hypothetical protein
MSKNSVNKAVIFVADDYYNEYDNGIKLPAKSELNSLVSDMLKSPKNDIRMVYNMKEDETINQDYIPILQLRNTRRDRTDEMERILQRMDTDKKMREMSERSQAEEQYKLEQDKMIKIAHKIAQDAKKADQIAKEQVQAKEIEMIMVEIKNKILAEEEQRTKLENKAHDEEYARLYSKIKLDAENEVRAEIKDLIEEQSMAIQAQLDSQFKETDKKIASIVQEKNNAEKEANMRAQKEVVMMAQKEAVMMAQQEANMKAQQEAAMREEQEAAMREEQEAAMREEQEAIMREEQEAIMREEQEADMREEQEAIMREEQEAIMREEQEAAMREEQEAAMREEQEANMRAQQEAVMMAQQEANMKAQQEANMKTQQEIEMKINQNESLSKIQTVPVFQMSTEKFNNKERFENSFFESSTFTWILVIILVLLILFVLNRHFKIINI